ncbi:MAG: hypothetical protein HFH53_09545 [Hespellia sp.]|nr:hypothetical protein [Hespellia sp.]
MYLNYPRGAHELRCALWAYHN